eukprot:TRINITY_DN4652_c0_g1_i2.p1 TRINITY_DN4652_c0_g1~~TRINITY_DN4652_c0_g1_i2.p1  ORF type:complete len:175 (-),score=28.53 TRINITY_DN4652_c0_g1_i2:66-590(-)
MAAAYDYPELSTVTTKEECIKVAEEAFTRVKEMEADQTWTQVSFSDPGFEDMNDVKLYEKTMGADQPYVRAGKSCGTLPVPPAVMRNILWEMDRSIIDTFDKDMHEFDVYLKASDTVQLVRTSVRIPFPVSNREFLTVRGMKEENGVYYIYSTSVNSSVGKHDDSFLFLFLKSF